MEEKPVKRLITPAKKNYETTSREILLALALKNYKGDERLKTEQGISDVIFEMTERKRSFNQSAIAKAKKFFEENEVYVDDSRAVIRKNSRGYFICDNEDLRRNKVLKMIDDGLFTSEKLYYNDAIGVSTMFVFKVDKEHKDAARKGFYELIGRRDIFDMSWRGGNFTILLDPKAPGIRNTSNLLKNFFEVRPAERS